MDSLNYTAEDDVPHYNQWPFTESLTTRCGCATGEFKFTMEHTINVTLVVRIREKIKLM